MDLDAAGTEEVERPELRNERVTGPGQAPGQGAAHDPGWRAGEEEIEEGEIYEAPRKTLPRVELFARRQKQDEEEPAIEIDHNDPTAGAADEEDIVPVEIVPVIQPVRVQEEAPAAPMEPEAPAAEDPAEPDLMPEPARGAADRAQGRAVHPHRAQPLGERL